MKSIAPTLAFVSLAAAGLIQTRDIQSKPFHLVIAGTDPTVNGKKVDACHSGAAIESLCIGEQGVELYFNTTKGEVAPLKDYTVPGELIYNLPVEPTAESEIMSFYTDPATNVAQLMFEPGYDQQDVVFSKSTNKMVIVSYLDDGKTPPTEATPRALNRWYVCQTLFEGYQYQTLNWLLGNGTPQNPSCVKVDVKRKFV